MFIVQKFTNLYYICLFCSLTLCVEAEPRWMIDSQVKELEGTLKELDNTYVELCNTCNKLKICQIELDDTCWNLGNCKST